MTPFQLIAVLLTLVAIGGYVNQRSIGLPATIGHMTFAFTVSLLVILLGKARWLDTQAVSSIVEQIDFSGVLLHGMLSFLLFACVLHINLEALKSVKWAVAILATVGVAIATCVMGSLVWQASGFAGLQLPYLYALLFDALIPPTDPIAVLAILKEAG